MAKYSIDENGVSYREGIRQKFIPYEKMKRAYERIQEVNGKLCCGSAVFTYFKLVITDDSDRENFVLLTEKEDEVSEALEKIHTFAPFVPIGVNEA